VVFLVWEKRKRLTVIPSNPSTPVLCRR
jgi:hypothetical protein